jgi:hypothetical protein
MEKRDQYMYRLDPLGRNAPEPPNWGLQLPRNEKKLPEIKKI